MLGMTKKLLNEHERERPSQAKLAEGKEGGYTFDDTHSVNPVAGQPDDGTAFTKTGNYSLGDTAYDVVMVGDSNSKMEEIAADLCKDEDRGTNSMDLDIRFIKIQASYYRNRV
jgi:hypothetical protein